MRVYILSEIVKNLDESSILKCALVSREWLAIARSEIVWKKKLETISSPHYKMKSLEIERKESPYIKSDDHSFLKFWMNRDYMLELKSQLRQPIRYK